MKQFSKNRSQLSVTTVLIANRSLVTGHCFLLTEKLGLSAPAEKPPNKIVQGLPAVYNAFVLVRFAYGLTTTE